MKVLKFGGSSLADADQFRKVKNIVDQEDARSYVVVSAPGKGKSNDHKVTDLLIMVHQLAQSGLQLDEVFSNIRSIYSAIVEGLGLDIDIKSKLDEIQDKIQKGASRDYTLSRGEYLNGLILSSYLGWDFVDAKDIIFFKDGRLDETKTDDMIKDRLKDRNNVVMPGFYGSDEDGKIKTFSRGGSDITGSLVSKGVDADLYENWTDVPGFLIADPKIVPDARPIEAVTYSELRELSYMGAPVLHEEAVFPLREGNIPINIKDTNNPDLPGTIIVQEDLPAEDGITGIAGSKKNTAITIHKDYMNSEVGFLRKLFSVFETNHISIDHTPSSVDSISVIVESDQLNSKLDKVLNEIQIYTKPDSITVEEDLAIIAVVGRGLRGFKGVSGRIFTALGASGINITMISQGSSELNIILGVKDADFETAIEAIYKEFF